MNPVSLACITRNTRVVVFTRGDRERFEKATGVGDDRCTHASMSLKSSDSSPSLRSVDSNS